MDPNVSGWLTRRARELSGDDRYPAVAEALTAQDQFHVMHCIVRLTGSGWTLEDLDAALVRARTHTSRWGQADDGPLPYSVVLDWMSHLAHLPQAEFDIWSTAFDHDLYRMTEPDTRLAIDAWRACVPGPAGPYCAAAGLSMDEAAAMAATGVLDQSTLEVRAGLRRSES